MTLTLRIFGREVFCLSSETPNGDRYEDRTGVFLGFRNEND